jgi:hypothetical protein
MTDRGHLLPAPLEEYEQRLLAQYLDARKFMWHHSPLGGLRNRIVAAKLKAHGAKAGFPDIVIFDEPPRLHGIKGMVIELKRRNGTLSDVSAAQRQWLADFEKRGYRACVAFGADHAIAQIEALYGRP